MATSTNSVGACLKQIPNQPIVFQVFNYPIIPKSLTRKDHNHRPSHGYIVKLEGLDQKSAVQNSQPLLQGFDSKTGGGLDHKSAVQNSQPLWQGFFYIKNTARGAENSGPRFSGLDPQVLLYIMELRGRKRHRTLIDSQMTARTQSSKATNPRSLCVCLSVCLSLSLSLSQQADSLKQ